MIGELRDPVRRAIVRNRFSSGTKKHEPGELGEMEGTPPPSYHLMHGGRGGPVAPRDPTGEDAIWSEIDDEVARTVTEMVAMLHHVRTKADWLQSRAIAHRALPECEACGKPINGRIIAGYCRKCWDRWDHQGKPDRSTFEAAQRNAQPRPTG
jgi:hypothetical protein